MYITSSHPYIKEIDVFVHDIPKPVGCIGIWNKTKALILYRRPEHYFIKYQGFGIDLGLLNNIIANTDCELIIIRYDGVKGLKYYESNLDDWIGGEHVEYMRPDGTSHGKQVVIGTKNMKVYEYKGW